jgi:phytoene synthase
VTGAKVTDPKVIDGRMAGAKLPGFEPAGAGSTVGADVEAVEALVRRAGTSFHRGMAVLPAARRQAMFAIYAFCRIVDDIADDPSPLDARQARLDAWRGRVAGLFHGESDDAVTRELARAIAAFGLRQVDFEAVIDGMQMDAETAIVGPDLATLDLYCDRVAAAVGRLSVRAFGDASPAADDLAHHLGRALQLTNILRDLAEDAARDRLYLPREFLVAAGVPAEPRAALAHPALPVACARLAGLARAHFRHAFAAMARCDRRAMKPARLMAAMYLAVLARLERRGWERADIPIRVPGWQKLWIAVRHGLA